MMDEIRKAFEEGRGLPSYVEYMKSDDTYTHKDWNPPEWENKHVIGIINMYEGFKAGAELRQAETDEMKEKYLRVLGFLHEKEKDYEELITKYQFLKDHEIEARR